MKSKIQLAALLMLIAGATVTVSCKKEVKENKQKTKMELLTAGSWKRTAFVSDPAYDWYGDGNFVTNILNVMQPCDLDNFETYYTDGTWQVNDGPTKCDEWDSQTRTAPWVFTDNETMLVFSGYDEYTLVELTATTLKMSHTFLEGGVIYTHNETFGH